MIEFAQDHVHEFIENEIREVKIMLNGESFLIHYHDIIVNIAEKKLTSTVSNKCEQVVTYSFVDGVIETCLNEACIIGMQQLGKLLEKAINCH